MRSAGSIGGVVVAAILAAAFVIRPAHADEPPDDSTGAEESSPTATLEVAIETAPPLPRPRHLGEGLFNGWKTVHLAEGGFAGFEPHVLQLRRSADEGPPIANNIGVVFRGSSQIYMRSWYPRDDKSVRARLDFALGVDSSGFAGEIRHEVAGGFRASFGQDEAPPSAVTQGPLTPHLGADTRDSLVRVFTRSHHAIIGRLGYHLSAVGDQDLYRSSLRPQLEVGYAYDGVVAFELRAELGWLFLGSRNVRSFDRELDMSPTLGGVLVMHSDQDVEGREAGFHGELSMVRTFDDGRPIDEVSGSACTRTQWEAFEGLCARVDVGAGDAVEVGAPRNIVSMRFGLTASFGWMDP